jgi:hypothetical protein
MKTVSPKVAVVCVPSVAVTNSQNVLTISAETLLNTQSILHHSDTYPEKITASGR